MPTRYEILGIEERRSELGYADMAAELEENLEGLEEDFYGVGNYPLEYNQTGMRHFDLMTCYQAATYRHLQLEQGECDVQWYVEEGPQIAVDYFYGDYLKKDRNSAYAMKKSPRNHDLSWFSVYRYGLFFSFMANDVESELKLIDWIEPTLPFDESCHLVSVYDNDYHKLMAEYIKHQEFVSTKLVRKFASCRKQRPKLLFACLEALRDCEEQAFVAGLKKFLDYYYKRELGEDGVDSYFSIEASILWFLAEWMDLYPKGLSERQLALIMTRDTLGLDS